MSIVILGRQIYWPYYIQSIILVGIQGCLASKRPWEVVYASKFALFIKGCNVVFLSFIRPMDNNVDYIHRSAYGGWDKQAYFEGDHSLLTKLVQEFQKYFTELTYPTIENKTLLIILLIKPLLPQKCKKSYLLN